MSAIRARAATRSARLRAGRAWPSRPCGPKAVPKLRAVIIDVSGEFGPEMSPLQELLVSDYLGNCEPTTASSRQYGVGIHLDTDVDAQLRCDLHQSVEREFRDLSSEEVGHTRLCQAKVLRSDGLRPPGPVDPIPDSANQRRTHLEVLG